MKMGLKAYKSHGHVILMRSKFFLLKATDRHTDRQTDRHIIEADQSMPVFVAR